MSDHFDCTGFSKIFHPSLPVKNGQKTFRTQVVTLKRTPLRECVSGLSEHVIKWLGSCSRCSRGAVAGKDFGDIHR